MSAFKPEGRQDVRLAPRKGGGGLFLLRSFVNICYRPVASPGEGPTQAARWCYAVRRPEAVATEGSVGALPNLFYAPRRIRYGRARWDLLY